MDPSVFEAGICVRDGALDIQMAKQQLDNNGAQQWVQWLGKYLPEFIRRKGLQIRSQDGFHIASQIDFSSNQLGDQGFYQILKQLFDLKIGAEKMRFDHNKLGRASAYALSGYIRNQPVPLLELHLSHNYFRRQGVDGLINLLGKDDRYPPVLKDNRPVPLWLRLENNIIEKPEELFNELKEKMKSRRRPPQGAVLICEVYREENGCGAGHCINCRPGVWCPILHLTYIKNQGQTGRNIPNEASGWASRQGEERFWCIGEPPPASVAQPRLPVAAMGPAGVPGKPPDRKSVV